MSTNQANFDPYQPVSGQDDLPLGPRPIQGFVKVVCIFFIVLGALGLLQTLQTLAGLAISMANSANGGPATINPFAGAQVIALLIATLNFFVSVGEIIGGVMGLQQKRLGALLIRGISAFMLVFKIVETAFTAVFTYLSMDAVKAQVMKDMQKQPNGPDIDMGSFLEIGLFVGIGLSIGFGVLMFLFYLFSFLTFNRQKTLSQFN
ncbi:MAG: hypothetical protein ACOVLE_14465 [Pirellula staleyi]